MKLRTITRINSSESSFACWGKRRGGRQVKLLLGKARPGRAKSAQSGSLDPRRVETLATRLGRKASAIAFAPGRPLLRDRRNQLVVIENRSACIVLDVDA